MKQDLHQHLLAKIDLINDNKIYSHIIAIKGLLVEIAGGFKVAVGESVLIYNNDNKYVMGEVVGFDSEIILAMPLGNLYGVGFGSKVVIVPGRQASIYPHYSWLGKVINAYGESINDEEFQLGAKPYIINGDNVIKNSNQLNRIDRRVATGIRAIDAFTACFEGQRMGIFSASGIGKSSLLSMVIKNSDFDVIVLGLIGERSREVREFIEDDLGDEGMKRSVIIASTAGEPILLRYKAAFTTVTVAEYFRDQGYKVLCLVDSITRFAFAGREIGLARGEPVNNGYPPSVLSDLSKLIERTGPGYINTSGSITLLTTVLVEGDNHDEYVSDSVRGLLDGHIILERYFAEQGRYPPINILRSISRIMTKYIDANTQRLIAEVKRIVSLYEDMKDLIRLGAYVSGSNPEVDRAIRLYPCIEDFLRQDINEKSDDSTLYQDLARAIEWQELEEVVQ